MRGLQHFKVRGKHVPRFLSPFKITSWRERSIEDIISNFLLKSVRISRMRFILRRVGLSHPKISNFGM
jgi:hypothetical protein